MRRVLDFLLGLITWHSENSLSRLPSKYLWNTKNKNKKKNGCPLFRFYSSINKNKTKSKQELRKTTERKLSISDEEMGGNRLPFHELFLVPVEMTKQYSCDCCRILWIQNYRTHFRSAVFPAWVRAKWLRSNSSQLCQSKPFFRIANCVLNGFNRAEGKGTVSGITFEAYKIHVSQFISSHR